MTEPVAITGWHAHVYYDAGSRPRAAALRDGIAARFPAARLGRWHDVPVGPHPKAMYQVAFANELLPALVPFLALQRGGLTILSTRRPATTGATMPSTRSGWAPSCRSTSRGCAVLSHRNSCKAPARIRADYRDHIPISLSIGRGLLHRGTEQKEIMRAPARFGKLP